MMFEIIMMIWWWCLCHVVCRFVEGRCRGHGWGCPVAPTLSNDQKEVPRDMGSAHHTYYTCMSRKQTQYFHIQRPTESDT